MLKLTFVLSVLFVALIAHLSASPVSSEGAYGENENQGLSPDAYQAALLAIKRSLMARMLLDEAQYEPEEERIEKRFPKWRMGDTKSRVDQLKYNRHGPSSAWANSMIEKNKLYEKMHG